MTSRDRATVQAELDEVQLALRNMRKVALRGRQGSTTLDHTKNIKVLEDREDFLYDELALIEYGALPTVRRRAC